MKANSTTRWPLVPLGTLAEFRNGINFSKDNFGSGIKVIGVGDFQNNVRASFDSLEEINPDGIVRKEHLLRNGDILFVRSNGNRELIGRSMFIQGLAEDVTHSAFSIRLRFVSGDCQPQFYAYLFRSSWIRQALSLHGSGTNISNLNQDTLGRLEVPLPSKPVQCKIASILATYDDLIENNTRRIEILEEMAKMIYREWFVDFRFPGRKTAKMVESEIGLIPDGWKVVELAALYKTGSGGTPSRKVGGYFGGSIPWVKTRELTDGLIIDTEEKITNSGLKCSSAKLFPPRTVLMAMYGATIGKLGMLTSAATCNQACCAMSENVDPFGAEYLFLTLKHKRNEIIGLRMGAAQQNISQEVIRSIRILRPIDQVVSSFNQLAGAIFDELRVLTQMNINLRQTRDLLLPKFMSGEIIVEQAEAQAVAQSV